MRQQKALILAILFSLIMVLCGCNAVNQPTSTPVPTPIVNSIYSQVIDTDKYQVVIQDTYLDQVAQKYYVDLTVRNNTTQTVFLVLRDIIVNGASLPDEDSVMNISGETEENITLSFNVPEEYNNLENFDNISFRLVIFDYHHLTSLAFAHVELLKDNNTGHLLFSQLLF